MSNAIVIGGGHNGLAAAFYLAKAGHKPIVLERREDIGGGALTGTLHPGFYCPTLSHNVLLHECIVREMDLRRHGAEFLTPAAHLFAPSTRGAIVLWDDVGQSVDGLRRTHTADADAYAVFRAAVRSIASVLATTLESQPPAIDGPGAGDLWNLLKTGRAFRALGARDGHRLLRWLPMPVADMVAEWFETEALRAAIAGPGLSGTMLGPRSAGSTLVLMLLEAHQLLAGGARRVRGGPGALVRAMATAAKAAGAEIRPATPVDRIVVRNGRVAGVVAGGQELPAAIVVSAVDPKTTLLRLVAPGDLDPGVVRKIGNYRAQGTVAKVNLALSGLPAFTGAARDEAVLSGRIHVGPSLDYMERAFDHAKYGQVSADPWLEVTLPSILDPGLAPAGAHVASVYVHYAPHRLRTGPWSTWRNAVLASTLRVLERHAPGISSLVVASQLITPEDLDRDYGLWGGHIFHGELAPDQLFTMRPLLGFGRYESPIRGLYLGGAGTHPGGFMTGAAGRLAAREAIRGRRLPRS
jgi:phytoene dehydrogenase-like protein